ncbi:hypothetical protein BD779DRAFT_1491491 [Infundibulicybe gibba]|nr:hypothetical protein BD779DRAFT_1491491 [Infundibulicybe gibba]
MATVTAAVVVPNDEPTVDNGAELTPLRAHYLKKSLIQLQFKSELDAITSASTLSPLGYLGPPFAPPPKDAQSLDLPFLRWVFRQFVLTFPFMAAAPKDFYANKLQPFVASALARNISVSGGTVLDDPTAHRGAETARAKLLVKTERNLALFLGSATKLVEREEVVRLSQADLERLELIAAKRRARIKTVKDVFEVNIVSVRTVVDKGRMRSRAHEEFIVRTRRSHFPDIFVSRRYGDFKTLASELRKAHPEESIRSPPAKDRTVVSAPPLSPTTSAASTASSQYDEYDYGAPIPSRLAREKNRLTLRAYLHSLLASTTIASSPVLRSFLLSGPTTLSPDEMEDARRREEADHLRDDGRKRFAREIASRVEALRGAVKSVKGDIMGRDGLTHVFATIKVTPDVRDLPENYRAVLEWARISLASTVFQHFVAADNSSETFAGLKRIHGLMPYVVLKTALKISNPISMIRNVLDLFLAQPFGGRSLLQRMFTSSLTEEVKALEEEIEAVKDKVEDPIMCEKVRMFVYAPREIQDMYKSDAAEEKLNILTIVLRSGEEPVLSRVQMNRLARAQRAHTVYMRHRDTLADSDDDDGPQDEDAWLLEDLKVLAYLYSRLRDREQLIALIFEGFTADLLKDIITIFYSPLAQVYRAASIADSLSDLQNFINDLIKTVEQVEELSQEDPHRTVQEFINLIQRHEQAFYHFVHKVHSKGEGLFDSLMRWIELFLTFVREGLGAPISLEFLLPHTGKERTDILAEVDRVALYHYKLKVLYEDKLRRRFGRAQGGQGAHNEADAEDDATQALVNGIVGEISFGELVQGEADDLAAEETDESEESSEYESATDDDETSEESEEESSQESPPTPEKKRIRSASIFVNAPPNIRRDTAPPPPTPPITRKHSFSLRVSRSMNFSKSQNNNTPSPARLSHDVPPVPPLPAQSKSLHAALSKPLPPSPVDMMRAPTTPSMSSPLHQRPSPPVSPPKAKPKPKKPETLSPPQLQHIPQLLPVFTEMMRPLLRPRQQTSVAPSI